MNLSGPQMAIVESVKDFNLLMGGQGSGKTRDIGVISSNFITEFPECRGIIAANTYGQLSKATLNETFKVWAECGMIHGRDYVSGIQPPPHFKRIGEPLDNYKNTISHKSGGMIWAVSLDNFMNLDGVEATYALLDEIKDTHPKAVYEVVVPRLRQKTLMRRGDEILRLKDWEGHEIPEGFVGWNPFYGFTSPPETTWLLKMFEIDQMQEAVERDCVSKDGWFQKDTENSRTVIFSSWHNEENLPKGEIEKKIELFKHTPGMVEKLVYGSPFGKSGGEWYSNFHWPQHVHELDYDPELPIHITFDFNFRPYLSCLIIQVKYPDDRDGDIDINVINEFAMRPPHNMVNEACRMVINSYPNCAGAYFYGDPSGRNRDNKSPQHYYDIIEHELAEIVYSDGYRVLNKAPRRAGRRTLMCNLMSGEKGVRMRIDPKCKELLADMTNLQTDTNGEFIKKKVDGVEPHGHFTDAFSYFIHYDFEWLMEV